MLYAVGALVSAIIAVGCFISIRGEADGGMLPIVIGIVFAILTIIFGTLFLSGRVNKTEDIHITE